MTSDYPEFSQDPESDILDDRMVTPEKSMFGTRIPRPTGVGRHLMVVIILFLLALGLSIFFAERGRGGDDPVTAPEEVQFKPPMGKPAP